MFDVVTRLIISAIYFVAAAEMWRATRTMRPGYQPYGWFLLMTLAAWGVWYIVLAADVVSRDPWGTLNRGLHAPLGTAVWMGARAMSRRDA